MGIFDPDRHDNLLNIVDLDQLNEYEALGVIRAENYILDLDIDFVFDTRLILDIHVLVFGELYDWAGKWRTQDTNIGILKERVPYAAVEYAEQVNYFKNNITSKDRLIECLSYTHHRYTQIHPFNNGNGRTARLITDLISKTNGYQNIQLYVQDSGNSREIYKAALKAADNFDDSILKNLIADQLRSL